MCMGFTTDICERIDQRIKNCQYETYVQQIEIVIHTMVTVFTGRKVPNRLYVSVKTQDTQYTNNINLNDTLCLKRL